MQAVSTYLAIQDTEQIFMFYVVFLQKNDKINAQKSLQSMLKRHPFLREKAVGILPPFKNAMVTSGWKSSSDLFDGPLKQMATIWRMKGRQIGTLFAVVTQIVIIPIEQIANHDLFSPS